MREHILRFLHRCQMPLLMALGLQSVNLTVLAFFGREILPVAWLSPAAYLLCVFVSIYLPGKYRIAWASVMAVGSCVAWFVLLPAPSRLVGSICACLFAAAMVWSLRFAVWSDEQEGSDFWLAAGAVMQIIFLIAGFEAEQLQAVNGRLSLLFFGYIFLLMLSRNRTSMVNASDTRQRVPDSMRRKNIMLVVGLFGMGTVIALLPSAYRAFLAVLKWIIALIDLLWSEAVPGSEKLTPSQLLGLDVMEGVAAQEDPLWVMELLTMITKGIIIVGGLWAVWRLIKLLREKIPKLLRMLERYSVSVSQDYVDEITSTRDFDLVENLRNLRFKPRVRYRDERNMSPNEKVRYRYQRLLIKYPQWTQSNTARENLPASAAQIYEKARYSDRPVLEDEASAFKKEIKNI